MLFLLRLSFIFVISNAISCYLNSNVRFQRAHFEKKAIILYMFADYLKREQNYVLFIWFGFLKINHVIEL